MAFLLLQSATPREKQQLALFRFLRYLISAQASRSSELVKRWRNIEIANDLRPAISYNAIQNL